ncbi:uncharacterized protein LOC106160304 [Lingula anatina]|uniref:Uncharacterized protein LOC106160304 n=1 Tax=Lingula anatina TaxID=7574 RepID=A0A1S3I240_LINAN|nr:uncharacterized protein LOC106160304 [Lingula anatina]|eukprot:XP_013392313.1 uncharacterized protein LOC106160304 [Lingula anatina]
MEVSKLAVVMALFVMHAYAQLSPTADDVIDMTYLLTPDTLHWPGLTGFNYTRISRGPVNMAAGWFEDNDFCGQEHQGTHMDAPAHFSKGKWRLHDIPPHRFFGPAVRIDISSQTAQNNEYNLQVEDVQKWEKENGPILDNALVFIYTGWGKHHDNRTAYYGYGSADSWLDANGNPLLHFPAVSEDAAKWISSNKKIAGIGTDGPSVGPSKTMMAHVPLLEKNIFSLESVANLDKLATTGDAVAALPVNVKDGSGAPVRIVAFKKAQFKPGPDDVIDLTYALSNETVMWPGRNPFQLFVLDRGLVNLGNNTVWLEQNRFCTPEHAGTHLDAPAHFIKGSWRTHDIPAHTLIGPAVRVDISKKAENNPDAVLTVQDLEDWEKENGRIPDNAMVFLHTGWGKFFTDFEKYLGSTNRTNWLNDEGQPLVHYPGFSEAAAKWLVNNRNINGIGSDTISYDAGQTTSFPAHVAFLGAKKLALENVANLDKLPNTGTTAFVFHMLYKDGSGAPTRVVAIKNSAITAGQVSSGVDTRSMFVALMMPFFLIFFRCI